MRIKTENRATRYVKPKAIIRYVQFLYHGHTVTIKDIIENKRLDFLKKPLALGYNIKLVRLDDNCTS